jgi:ATP phosphoribosyltransferase regulatory subunit
VEDLLSIAGISSVSGRSAGEIAERFLEQAALRDGEGFSAEKRAVIESYLAIAGDPDDCAARLRKLAKDAALDLAKPLDEFEARIGFIAARGFDVSQIAFATAFARNLDYYTGFVFEAYCKNRPALGIIAGGGRYDNLLTALGAKSPVPAVGAAIWCDRLAANAEQAQ